MRPKTRSRLGVLLLVIGACVLLGYWAGWPVRTMAVRSPFGAVGTSGTSGIEHARDRGAELGEEAAAATARAHETMSEAVITAKIKAKMTLDDSVKARAIVVSTTGHTVTISGNVRSVAEGDRAMTLARETGGVTQVIDRLFVQQPHQDLARTTP
jgi:hyperosmotically inducible protein